MTLSEDNELIKLETPFDNWEYLQNYEVHNIGFIMVCGLNKGLLHHIPMG